MKTILNYIPLVFVLSLISCDIEQQKEALKEQPISVKTMTVSPETRPESKTYFGELKFLKASEIVAQQSGRITKLLVKPGMKVKKGEVMLEYPIKDHQLQIDQANIEYQKIENDYKRQSDLYRAGAVTQVSVEGLKAQLDIQAKAIELLKQTQVIKAPFNGVVTQVSIHQGQDVEMNTPLLNLAETNHLTVEFYVGQQDIASVKAGNKVCFMHQNQKIEGQIKDQSYQMDPKRKAFKVEAIFSDGIQTIKTTGQTVEIKIETGEQLSGIWIPVEAVKQIGRKSIVFLVKQGRVQLKEIGIGYRNQQIIQVVKGLQQGDHILTAGIEKVENGSLIKVIK